MYDIDEDEAIVTGTMTIDRYYLAGWSITVRANGTAYVTLSRGGFREFGSENAARRWAEDHLRSR